MQRLKDIVHLASGQDELHDLVPKAARIAVLVNPRLLRPRYEAYGKLHMPLDCKLR